MSVIDAHTGQTLFHESWHSRDLAKFVQLNHRAIVVTSGSTAGDWLPGAVQERHRRGKVTDVRHSVVFLDPPKESLRSTIEGLFDKIVWGPSQLPKDELLEVLSHPEERGSAFIAGSVDLDSKTLNLVTGDLRRFAVPFEVFPPTAAGLQADFDRFSLEDYGRTVRLGEYEASADAILYEVDPSYRRKLKKHRREQEQSFGASLRRLRVQRRMRREDISGVSAKEIARIERNEVMPHQATLEKIAQALQVEPDEIETY